MVPQGPIHRRVVDLRLTVGGLDRTVHRGRSPIWTACTWLTHSFHPHLPRWRHPEWAGTATGLLGLALLGQAGCGGNTATPASESVMTGEAPSLRSWSGATECCGEDAHPVHGDVLTDGSVVLVGKSILGGGTAGFATRWLAPEDDPQARLVDEDATIIQATRVLERDSALLQVLDAGEAVVAVGFEADSPSSDAVAVAIALDPESLETLARLEVPASEASRSAVFESIALHSDGDRLVLGGSHNARRGELEGFKSYGNVVGGEGLLVELDLSTWLGQGSASTAQSPSDVGASTRSIPETYSVKSLRIRGDGGLVAVGSDVEERSGMLWVDAGLTGHQWTAYDENIELTDVAVLAREGLPEAYAVVGHGGDGVIDGHVGLVDADGASVWTIAVGNPGVAEDEVPEAGLAPNTFIFDECWGVDTRGDEVVAACGTGIEGCDEVSGSAEERSACRSDPRRSWRSFLVGVTASGELSWSRADSFVDESGEAAESAAEFLVTDEGGDLYAVIDQVFGVGLARFGD
jgi:hypothetical protein